MEMEAYQPNGHERPSDDDGVPIVGCRRRARRENYGMERIERKRKLRAVMFISLLPFMAAAISLVLYVAGRPMSAPNEAAAASDGTSAGQLQSGDASVAHERNSTGGTPADIEGGLITTSTSRATRVPTQYSNDDGQAEATISAENINQTETETGAELDTDTVSNSPEQFSSEFNSTGIEQNPTQPILSTPLADSTSTTSTIKSSKPGKPSPEIQTSTGPSSWVNATENVSTSTLPFPYPFPAVRYREWSTLERTTRMIAAAHLDYTRTTWNVHGYAPIEGKGWVQLDPYERQGATQIGFDEDVWDCFINHYESMTWDELVAGGVAGNFEALGWTRADLEGGIRPPADSKNWGQLTDAEKVSAAGLCYFEDNWDGIDMNPNPSYFPHPPPEFRFVPWSELPPKTRRAARKLKYDKQKWNNFKGGAEDKDFFSLNPEERKGAEDIGFYPHTWDCYVNHYDSLDFDEFYGDLKVAIEALGWDRESWDNNTHHPASNDKYWSELSPEERAGATMMCYFAELWDGLSITEWYDYGNGANTAISSEEILPVDIDMSIFEE